MKRLLYIAFADFSDSLFGVNAKVQSQCRAFSEYGYDVALIVRQGSETVLIQNGRQTKLHPGTAVKIPHKRLYHLVGKQIQIRDIKGYVSPRQFDACYIRYDCSDPGFLSLLKALRRVCRKIALEIPTYPYEAENQYGLLSKAKLAVDRVFRRRLRRYIDWIVTFYSGFDTIFGIPVLVIPNGFDFTTMYPVKGELPEDGIHIIAVSSMREWHGYERFIEGMRVYYQDACPDRRNLILHLVGNGREYGKYKALAEAYGLEWHIVMEGPIHGEALDALYEKCALGIDSLARHRSGIDVLSSLKSREYGAKGLPMINSCKIDIVEDGFPYLLRVPADETPVDMQAVIAFYDQCFFTGKSRAEVGREVRDYVEARSGMKQTLLPVVRKWEA